MSNQQQSRSESAILRNFLRILPAGAAVAVAIILVALAWDGVGAAADETSWRIFLVGWAGAVAMMAAGFAVTLLSPRSALPLAALHVVIGLVVGLAIGTTDWTALSLGGWWQLWWTVPLLLFHVGFFATIRRRSGMRR